GAALLSVLTRHEQPLRQFIHGLVGRDAREKTSGPAITSLLIAAFRAPAGQLAVDMRHQEGRPARAGADWFHYVAAHSDGSAIDSKLQSEPANAPVFRDHAHVALMWWWSYEKPLWVLPLIQPRTRREPVEFFRSEGPDPPRPGGRGRHGTIRRIEMCL